MLKPVYLSASRVYRCLQSTRAARSPQTLLVSTQNLYMKVEPGVADLFLIQAAAASSVYRLPGKTSILRSNSWYRDIRLLDCFYSQSSHSFPCSVSYHLINECPFHLSKTPRMIILLRFALSTEHTPSPFVIALSLSPCTAFNRG